MQITKEDLTQAVSKGILNPEQADRLWEEFSQVQEHPSFNFSYFAYYLGAFIVLCAMGWLLALSIDLFGVKGSLFVTIAYMVIFFFLGAYLWQFPALRTPGGLLITLAVCMVPWMIYHIEILSGRFENHPALETPDLWFNGQSLYREFGTIIAASIALFFFPFPFLTLPLYLSLWAMSMDIPVLWEQKPSDDLSNWNDWASLSFGIAALTSAFIIDRYTKQDFAFWGYLVGTFAFWIASASLTVDRESTFFLFFIMNIGMMFLSILLNRKALMVFGVIGFFSYLFHLAYQFFANSILFPFSLSFIGILIVFLGIFYNRYAKKIEEMVHRILPAYIIHFIPKNRH